MNDPRVKGNSGESGHGWCGWCHVYFPPFRISQITPTNSPFYPTPLAAPIIVHIDAILVRAFRQLFAKDISTGTLAMTPEKGPIREGGRSGPEMGRSYKLAPEAKSAAP